VSGEPGTGARLLYEALDRMAHQIKNPLQAVSMNLEVIRMRVSREAPELWEELERYAGAVDDNVTVLDRRLRLLLALGRRSADDPPESVDVPELIRDFAAALRLGEEAPAVEVEAEGPDLAAEARPGFLLELLLDLHRWTSREHPAEERLPIRVRTASGEVELSFGLPAGARGDEEFPAERWRSLASRAGGEAGLDRVGEAPRLRVRLPTG